MSDITDRLISTVRKYVADAFAAVSARIDAFEKRISEIPAGPKGDPGLKGDPGTSITVEDVRPLIEELVKAIPPPKDGKDGASITLEDVLPLVQEAVKAIPPPKDGTSVTLEDVRPIIDEAVKAIPIPKDGKDGVSVGIDDVRAIIEEAVKAIPAPKDGVDGKSITLDDIRPLIESKSAEWALDFERRAHGILQGVIDKMPLPKDGLDGLGFDDLNLIHDGERSITLRFAQGERVKEFTFTIPCVIDRGVFKTKSEYEPGDGVTYGGSFWIAQRKTQSHPGENHDDWRLAVKRGRDGKDGEPGKKGDPGTKGRDGRDFNAVLPNGARL